LPPSILASALSHPPTVSPSRTLDSPIPSLPCLAISLLFPQSPTAASYPQSVSNPSSAERPPLLLASRSPMQQHRPFSWATWNIYLAFLAFRIFIALSPGYIHPDEFFQSAEITAGECQRGLCHVVRCTHGLQTDRTRGGIETDCKEQSLTNKRMLAVTYRNNECICQ